MIMIWSGRGFLVILVLFVAFIVGAAVIPAHTTPGFVMAFTGLATGLFSWYFGKKWNVKNVRTLTDEETGERFTTKNNHTLFWIPMQYWGIIFLALGGLSLVYGIVSAFIG